VNYEEFVALADVRRREAFGVMSPEEKAFVKKAHAQRWLDQQKGELSTRQVQVVEAAIAFITPSLYRDPADPELLKSELRLKAELSCALGREIAASAFRLERGTAATPDRSWRGYVDRWLAWFEDCARGSGPGKLHPST
jgi:hypothetical protein